MTKESYKKLTGLLVSGYESMIAEQRGGVRNLGLQPQAEGTGTGMRLKTSCLLPVTHLLLILPKESTNCEQNTQVWLRSQSHSNCCKGEEGVSSEGQI